MKLRSLRLNQFRKFTTPVELADLQDGLNVLSGPNEYGKSTLVRALQAVMFERYSSSAAPIKSLCNNASSAAPVVEASFDIGGGLYVVRKRFIRKAFAKLRLPDGTELEGEPAEDALRELLASGRPGKQGARAEDLGLWSMLWVAQGDALGRSAVPDRAQSTLRAALESSVGEVLGGQGSQRLPGVIASELAELLTSTGKERGRFREAREQVGACDAEVAALSERRATLHTDLDSLNSVNESLSALEDSSEETSMRRELDSAERRRQELSALLAKVEAGRTALTLHEMQVKQASDELASRQRLEHDVQQREQRIQETQDGLAVAQEELTVLEEALTQAKLSQEQASEQRRDADALLRALRHAREALELRVALVEKQAALAKAEAVHSSLQVCENELAANRVTQDITDSIDAAVLALDTAEARVSAAATRIQFALDDAKTQSVSLDGVPLRSGDTSVDALQPVRIQLHELGSITITPSVRDAQSLNSELASARERLSEALSAAGESSVSDAKEQARRRRDLLAQSRELRLQFALAVGSDRADDVDSGRLQTLRDDLESQRQRLSTLQQVAGDESAHLDDVDPTSLEKAEADAAAAEIQLQQSRDRLDRCAAQLSAHREQWDERRHLAQVERRELDRMRQELAQTPEPAALQARVDQASADLAAQQSALSELVERSQGDTLEAVAARIQRLNSALDTHHARRQKLETQQAHLQGAIAAAEGAGIDEKLADAERALSLAQQEEAQYARQAVVLELLDKTLRKAEKRAHDRFMAPIVAKLRPYLRQLFPGADIELSDSLQIDQLLRASNDSQSFDLLSQGTQEQLTILTRIAFAELMAEQGRPAMLVLDDALAYSDDRRMAQLFDVLTLASTKVQILLLTCREQSFARLGGHQVALQAVQDEALMSA